MIDWTNPKQHITEFFTVKDAIYLAHWGILANRIEDKLTPEIQDNLIKVFTILGKIQKIVNCKVIVHSAFRPLPYNNFIGGSKGSMHLTGQAIDFHVDKRSCDRVRGLLLPLLDPWEIRCEDLPNAPWIHIDTKSVASNHRFFKP